MSALLTITGLEKRFGGLTSLAGVDLHVNEGEIVSVIGPNGAGKTTMFNVITGVYTPSAGSIMFAGRELAGMPPSSITSLGIARTFQTVHLFPGMSVLENVMVGQHCRSNAMLAGAIFRGPKTRREEARIHEVSVKALSFFGDRLMGYRHDQNASALSYANRRRLEIARALATEPKVLLLDEPTAGMNPKETQELTGQISRLRQEWNLTIVVIEHDMRVVKGVSDRVVVLDHGAKIAEGSYQDVAHDPHVIEAYLGTKAEKA